MLNIGGDPNDASYRYKMPRLVTKIEGRGNGIKTVIVNMVDVAKALRCDPSYTTKFFGLELGAQSKFDRKNERAVVNGAFDAPDMQNILTKFLSGYILCHKCDLPELSMRVKGTITADCAACGWSGGLGGEHKLSTYIIKHPPKSKKKAGKSGKKLSKEERRKLKEERKRGKKVESESVAEKTDTTDAAVKEKPQKSENQEKAEKEKIVWHTDTSKEASAVRKLEEFKSMGSIHVVQGVSLEDLNKAEKKPVLKNQSPEQILGDMLASGASTAEMVAEVRRLELAREWGELKKFQVLVDVLFDYRNAREMISLIETHKEFLMNYTASPKSASFFIGVFEEIVGFKEPKLLPRVPILLQAFYEQEVLDEDAILAWFESEADPWIIGPDVAKDIREKAQPFITWLKEADESGSEEEEDEE